MIQKKVSNAILINTCIYFHLDFKEFVRASLNELRGSINEVLANQRQIMEKHQEAAMTEYDIVEDIVPNPLDTVEELLALHNKLNSDKNLKRALVTIVLLKL